jgi:hypothetical protein
VKRLIFAVAVLGLVACTSRSEPSSSPSAAAAPAPLPAPSGQALTQAASPTARAEPAPAPAASPLYFSLELRRDGELVAKPKLLGELDRPVRAERRQPGAAEADYQLHLLAQPRGERYHLTLEVALPDRKGHGELELEHGGIRKLELGDRPGALQLSVTLMRVDSPEFRALMDLSEQDDAPSI